MAVKFLQYYFNQQQVFITSLLTSLRISQRMDMPISILSLKISSGVTIQWTSFIVPSQSSVFFSTIES